MTEVAQEVLKLAREAAASVHPYSHNSALILDGERDGTDIVQSALAAIKTTTERAAKIAEQHDTGDCTREDMEARRIAEAIRELLK